jgi:hypothetical protein
MKPLSICFETTLDCSNLNYFYDPAAAASALGSHWWRGFHTASCWLGRRQRSEKSILNYMNLCGIMTSLYRLLLYRAKYFLKFISLFMNISLI